MTISKNFMRAFCATGVGALILGAAGCAPTQGVPPTSSLVAEAPGEAASFRAPREGTVWVAGPGGDKDHLIFSGQMHLGETLSIDPAQNQLVLDGHTMVAAVHSGSSYRIWFQPRLAEWHDWLNQ
jgi:hypothetical protein